MHQVGDDFDVSLNNFISVATGVSMTPVVSYVNEVEKVNATATNREENKRRGHRLWTCVNNGELSRLTVLFTVRKARKNGGR